MSTREIQLQRSIFQGFKYNSESFGYYRDTLSLRATALKSFSFILQDLKNIMPDKMSTPEE